MVSVTKLLLATFVIRACNALLLRTAFSPDEYWQSLEVAHRLVFGYGHLTWEWGAGIRGYLHPLLFAAPLLVLRALGLDTAAAVVVAPKLLQAAFAAATDTYVYLLTQQVFGTVPARWALLCQLLAWFNAYCLVRTVSSAIEATCLVAGLYHLLRYRWQASTCSPQFPAHRRHHPAAARSTNSRQRSRGLPVGPHQPAVAGGRHPGISSSHDGPTSVQMEDASGQDVQRTTAAGVRHLQLALLWAGLGVVIRPPSLLAWLPVVAELHLRTPRAQRRILLAETARLTVIVLATFCLLDRCFYNRWVLVPWEFVRFNLVQGGSSQYGGHPWHWNFTQGFPTVAATLLPIGLAGIYLTSRHRMLAVLMMWSLVTYSLPAHKEFRFLLPALQLLIPYCGLALAALHGQPIGASALDPSIGTAGTRLHAATPAGSSPRGDSGAAFGSHAEQQLGPAGKCPAQQQPASHTRRRQQSATQPSRSSSSWGTAALPPSAMAAQRRNSDTCISRKGHRRAHRRWQLAAYGLLTLQLPLAAYFGLLHQRGTISVMTHLAQHSGDACSVLFLTPCHATPLYSHLHSRIPTRFLDCSPPGWSPVVACLNSPGAPAGSGAGSNDVQSSGRNCKGSGSSSGSSSSIHNQRAWAVPEGRRRSISDCHVHYDASSLQDGMHLTEQQRFEQQPLEVLEGLFDDSTVRLPSHIVVFQHVYEQVRPWCEREGYVKTRTFTHAQFAVDRGLEAAVLLLERQVKP